MGDPLIEIPHAKEQPFKKGFSSIFLEKFFFQFQRKLQEQEQEQEPGITFSGF